MKEASKLKILYQNIQAGIMPSLTLFEISFYTVVWFYALFLAIERVYHVTEEYRSYFSPEYFTDGWSLLGRQKDVSEMEWTVWSTKYISFIPWIFVHIGVSQYLWLKKPQMVPYFYILFSSISMIYVIGLLPTLYLFTQALIMFPTYIFKSKTICWTVGLTSLVFLNIDPFSKLLEYIVISYSVEEYIMSIVTAWLNIRCLSFALHRCNESRKSKSLLDDLIHYLGFCFYFPLLYTGPLMMFNDFEKQLTAQRPRWNKYKLMQRTANIFRYIFWFLFYELILHYFYIHALRLHLELVSQCQLLALNGLGYSISQLFMVKYTVLYGLPGAIAQLEHFDPPPKPKCVARIHMYSDMWRYFDRGLYTFFTRYIYTPFLGKNRSTLKKFVGTIFCFAFVYIWHGATYAIFVWSFLNCVEVILEMVFAIGSISDRVIKFEEKWLTPTWSRRLRALFSVPMLYLGCISNFYFLVGYEATNIMVDRLIFNAPLYYFINQSLCLYCMCQVSIEIKNWEFKRSKVKKT